MPKPDNRPLDSFLCPACKGFIQARLGITGRADNYGWWIVDCANCHHLFHRRVPDGVHGSAIAVGGRIRRTLHGDENRIEDVEREVTTLTEEES